MEVSAVGLGRLHLQGGGVGYVRLSGHVLTSHHGHRYSASGQRQHAGACLGLLPLKTHSLEHVAVVRLGLGLV